VRAEQLQQDPDPELEEGDHEIIEDLRAKQRHWRHDAVTYVRDAYDVDPYRNAPLEIDEPQRRILDAISQHDKVVVRSCHDIGSRASVRRISISSVPCTRPLCLSDVPMAALSHLGNLEQKRYVLFI
jgi:hypothetical protein